MLVALAGSADADEVARLAGLDTRTANWHRSKLCLVLGLDREAATREQLLAAARRHGLLPASVEVVRDDLPVAAAPTSDGARQRRIRRAHAVQLALLDLELDETTESDDLMERAA
ncbi:hypothetical protein [Streptomyces sp. 8L]|uniref:hypothetical protein n=1 Tax=Streptomyces sp. 8L TaxID=2877242 RepID=UPI001CD49A17|nr:hypothetical protein [Streptomyces sp. 8L]MCA1223437.1 hypothetical protein [Streptomyces sp. 8L]